MAGVTATPDHRLPRSVEPVRYQLEIAPDLDGATFTGTEQVEVVVHEPVTEVVLNAAELEISEAELTAGDGRSLTGSVRLDAAEERAVVSLEGSATPGTWILRLTFRGALNDKLRGFYRSTFRDDAGTERVIATTQFEPTDARRAFPCWDEPDRKAIFSVTLVVAPGLAAVSNSPEVERHPLPDGRSAVRFADTMRMSTYLVALIVGPLEVTDPVDVDGVPLRVVHVPGKGHLSGFALEAGAHALRFFAHWFGIPYPADKLDLLALPDFAFGAMENLGAVTFRESLLLIDRERASHVELERVADVIAHEIAHMWFGDLVTMSWWNGLWLNEAFATFMEILCVDAYRPEWDRWVTFGLSRGAAMAIDGLPSTRAIEFPVARPEEAEGMFDALTYQKGAGVLRMLERYLGDEAFRSGIHRYLTAHAHGNADTTDLWDAIEEATGEPVRTTMDSWILQPGHPLVTVEPTGDGVTLSQRRFAYLGDGGTEQRWSVPVLVRASVGGSVENRRVLLSDASTDVGLGGHPEWVVANAGGWGFYRVRYSADLLAALTADIGRLDALERFNLLSDTWAAALTGLVPLDGFLSLTLLLGPDDDPSVWHMALNGLDFLHRVAGEERPAVEAFVRAVAGPAFARLGWEADESEPDKVGTLRATLLTALGTIGADPDVQARSAELHKRALADRSLLDPDLAAAVVSVVGWAGGTDDYEDFLARFRDPDNPQEEVRYLYALAAFRDPALVLRTLDMSLTEVRTQNAAFLLSGLLANRTGGPLAWEFVRGEWDRILERLPQNSIVRMLEGLSALCTGDLAPDIHAFFDGHPVRSGQQTLAQILERLDVNVAFAGREQGRIGAAVRARQPGAS